VIIPGARRWFTVGALTPAHDPGHTFFESADPNDPDARSGTRSAIISEQESLKNRVRQAAFGAFAAVSLRAGDALASEGDLVLFPDPVMLAILIALFLLLVYPLNQLIFRPIFRVLDERDAKIAGTREKAEKLFTEADEVLARYEGSVREVRAEAEQARKQVLGVARSDGGTKTAQARSEAEREVARAREEIAGALDSARSELRAQTEGLAREVATQTLGRVLS
jgi:F-type H+-transporting ATPase subunit b